MVCVPYDRGAIWFDQGERSVYFRILNNEASGELTYLLADLDAREAVLIDPRSGDMPVLLALLAERELRLRWVLRTHHHDLSQGDELAGLAQFGAPLVAGDTLSHLHLTDGAELRFGYELVTVFMTPGHTPACLSFGWRDRLFCGSLLSVTACPHQLRPAAPEALWDSVTQRIFSLPDETLLFAGHAQRSRAVTTVLEQRRWHPYFANQTRDEFLAQMAALPEKYVPISIL